MQTTLNPFERIRFRALVGYAILAFIATILSLFILGKLLPTWFKGESSPLRGPLTTLLLYVFFFLFTHEMVYRSGLSYDRLCGVFPAWRTLGRYNLWAVPLIIVSITSIYLLFFPLSFLFPGFVKWWLIETSPTVIWTDGDQYVIANLLNLFCGVLIAPILEEFFFRGILLARWTIKWNVVRAIIFSSVVFAVLHTDLMGSFCFACVMAILYIRTKSLFIPMSLHIVNNLTAWLIVFLGMQFDNSFSGETLAEFQASWWIGLVGLIVSIPFIIRFWRHYIRNTDWQVPYLIEPTDCENNALLSESGLTE